MKTNEISFVERLNYFLRRGPSAVQPSPYHTIEVYYCLMTDRRDGEQTTQRELFPVETRRSIIDSILAARVNLLLLCRLSYLNERMGPPKDQYE